MTVLGFMLVQFQVMRLSCLTMLVNMINAVNKSQALFHRREILLGKKSLKKSNSFKALTGQALLFLLCFL